MMAKMDYAGLASDDVPTGRTDQGFLDWMIGNNIEAVYVDHSLYRENPVIWEMIKPQIGKGLERIYSGDEGDIQVLLVKSKP